MADSDFLRRAIALAMLGRGGAEPNPMVGCVIVKDGRVIGEGLHRRYGGPHAEPDALARCTEDPAGGTAYVTLEPCCHHNKQTPPCVPRLIAAKIARVVIGCLDPNPAVNGSGVAQLRAAGIEVVAPVLDSECRQLIAPFLARVRLGRPYVTLKWAQSLDGKIAGENGRPARISNPQTTAIVHQLRSRCDGILVGIKTVLTDDPLLTARGVAGARPLHRYVLDTHCRFPAQSRLAHSAADDAPVTVFHGGGLPSLPPPVGSVAVQSNAAGRLDLSAVLGSLPRHTSHLLVEPGPTLAASFFADNLADRLWIITGRQNLPAGVPAAAVPLGFVRTGTRQIAGDTIEEWLNTNSPVFAAARSSADWSLLPAS